MASLTREGHSWESFAHHSLALRYIVAPPDRPIITLFSSSFDTEANYDKLEVKHKSQGNYCII